MKSLLKILQALMKSLTKSKGPKKIHVSEIVNALPDRGITFKTNNNQEIYLKPRETRPGIGNFSTNLLTNLDEISNSNVSIFQVEGDKDPCSFAVVNRVGIISALGTSPGDYDIHDKAATYLSWDRIKDGQKVRLRVVIDDDQVVWVVGDLIDNL